MLIQLDFASMICLVRWLRSFSVKGKLGMFAPRLVGWLVGWLIRYLVGLVIGWLVRWMVAWLVGWLAGWLAGWLTDSLAGHDSR